MNIKSLISLIVMTAAVAGCAGETATLTGTGDDGVGEKFTGVRPFYENNRLDKEVTYVKGKRNGLTKTYYPSGNLKQTFNFVDGRKSELATWYYEDGKVFRTTPYKNDTIHGKQIQYYRSGRLKAEMSYVEGHRLPDLKEYFDNNKQKIIRADIIIKTRDEYTANGKYKIFAELDNKNLGVVFFRGDLTDGAFNRSNLTKMATSGGVGYLELSLGPNGNNGYVGIIAEYTTDFGNKNYIYKKVSIPYKNVE